MARQHWLEMAMVHSRGREHRSLELCCVGKNESTVPIGGPVAELAAAAWIFTSRQPAREVDLGCDMGRVLRWGFPSEAS